MGAILVLSFVLYSRCCKWSLGWWQARRDLRRTPTWQLEQLRALRHASEATFHRQRLALGALVASAPLLGLLGTVTGMITTFESLAQRDGGKSMADLAHGISQVLVATESGLAVALPALAVIYGMNGQVRRYLEALSCLERSLPREASS